MVAIIDYNAGNVGSIQSMLKKAGIESHITNDAKAIKEASHLILPGVGHFDYCMKNLKILPVFDLIQERVLVEKTPILGICVGVQLLLEGSEEGNEAGLGWIKGVCKKFKFETEQQKTTLKIPHMGWCDVTIKKESKLFSPMHDEPRYYFVHSYYPTCENEEDLLLSANYGFEFGAGVEKGNVVGVQCHPEKSHKFGLKLLTNFVQHY
jgi:imidazole glycerol-phosphate synthase subunit HisH